MKTTTAGDWVRLVAWAVSGFSDSETETAVLYRRAFGPQHIMSRSSKSPCASTRGSATPPACSCASSRFDAAADAVKTAAACDRDSTQMRRDDDLAPSKLPSSVREAVALLKA